MASRPSAFKTVVIVLAAVVALPIAYFVLMWIVIGLMALFEGPPSRRSPGPSVAAVKDYVLRRPDCPFNCPDLNFHRAGERLFFFEDGDDFREVKSYDLRDGSVALWMRIPKADIFLVTFAFPADGDAVYAHHAQAGLFLKRLEDSPNSLGKEVASAIPEACGPNRVFFLSAAEERVLAGCVPRWGSEEAASENLSYFTWAPGHRDWSDRSPPPSAWKDGKLKTHAASGGLLFLAGEKEIHLFDPELQEIRPVEEQKKLFGDTTYQPVLGASAGVPYAAAGDKLYFWDPKTRSFIDPLANISSSLRFWYDDSESKRVLVDGEKAFIQISDDTQGRKGLGHFRKGEKGWVYRGLLEDISMVQPVALAPSETSLFLGDKEGLMRREIGITTCRPPKPGVFAGSFSWIRQISEGGMVRGKVLATAPEFCRIGIEIPHPHGKTPTPRLAFLALDGDRFAANFERVNPGDEVLLLGRWDGDEFRAERAFIERRNGAPVEGQTPWQNRPLTLALQALVFLLGGVSIFWALKRMSRAGEACLPLIFNTEKKVQAANRLRIVGLAVLSLGWLGLTANLKGRPLDALGFLESIALQMGAFWVVFALFYYIAAANLLKILRR